MKVWHYYVWQNFGKCWKKKHFLLQHCALMFNSGCVTSFFFIFSHHNHILIILRCKHMFVETCLCLRCLTSLYLACNRKCKTPQNYFEWTCMCILILSIHLCLVLPIGLFPSCFCTKNLYVFVCCPLCNTSHLSHSPWFAHMNSIWWGVQIMKLLTIQFSPLYCDFLPPSPKYPPQHLPCRQFDTVFWFVIAACGLFASKVIK